MAKFIEVNIINEDYQFQGKLNISIDSIANYGEIKYNDGRVFTRIVYKNLGLINSSIFVREDVEQLNNLIKK